MRLHHYIMIGLLLAILASIAILATLEDVDDFSPYNPLWNGLSRLRVEFKASPIPITSLPSLPAGTLVIAGPSRGFSDVEIGVLREFLGRGGTIVILEDYGSQGYILARRLGLNVEPHPGILLDPLFYYKDYPLAKVTFWGNVTAYFNYGTAFRGYNGTCIAYSSRFSFVDFNGNGVYDGGEPSGPLCVAVEARIGLGRLIVVADSSIAINSMFTLNTELLRSLLREGSTYILGDRWDRSLYSTIRSNLVTLYTTVTGTQLRYVVIVTLIALFPLIARVARTLRVGGVEGLEYEVKSLLSRHPTWREEDLRRILRDLYEVRGSKG